MQALYLLGSEAPECSRVVTIIRNTQKVVKRKNAKTGRIMRFSCVEAMRGIDSMRSRHAQRRVAGDQTRESKFNVFGFADRANTTVPLYGPQVWDFASAEWRSECAVNTWVPTNTSELAHFAIELERIERREFQDGVQPEAITSPRMRGRIPRRPLTCGRMAVCIDGILS